MVENTKIEWATHTFNPWIGCAKVSPGCEHCYAEADFDKRKGRVKWGVNGTRSRTSEAYWKNPIKWNKKAKKRKELHDRQPELEPYQRPRVFCASLADVFENRNELIPWRQQLFHLIERTPNLDWLILTKRPENVMHFAFQQQLWWPSDSIPSNAWIGTSVENQQAADERIPHLLRIPATVRFLSCEPLLGPVDVSRYFGRHWSCPECGDDDENGKYLAQKKHFHCGKCAGDTGRDVPLNKGRQSINWVIVGGESGPNARPMHPDWARSIRDQCQAAGVAFHFKQWGEWHENGEGIGEPGCRWGHVLPDGTWQELPRTLETSVRPMKDRSACMLHVGKKAAGRLLDGREWNEFPAV